MRIRKRFHSPLPPPPPLSTAAAAPSEAAAEGAAGGKEAGVAAAAAAAAGRLRGLGDGSGRWGGSGLHPDGDLPAQTLPGCTTNPTPSLLFHPPPDAVPTADGGERGDLPPRGTRLLSRDMPPNHGHGGQALKGEHHVDGDALIGRRNTVVLGAASATAPKSLSVGAPEVSLGHGGHNTLHNGEAAAAAQATARWSDDEKDSTLKKRMRRCYRARGSRSGPQELEKNAVAEAMKPRSSKTRRRVTTSSAATSTATIAAAGANYSLITVFAGSGGAPKATGAGAAECDDAVVKEEGGDDMSAEGVAAVNGDRSGCRNGKKRRSPAVLMEGSRCSRVNGRGWRCCQQTLVGYSLCEHHLGKGRLRSVASVRCNGRARKKEEAEDGAALSLPFPVQQKRRQLLWGDGEHEDEESLCKRRRKIGTVKARSISSLLLHQPDYSTPTTMASPSSSPPPPPQATGRTISAVSTPHDSDCAVA